MSVDTRPPVFLSAEWRHLLMASYAVPPALLLPHVPPGTELDIFEGKALASVIGFRFLRTRLLGVGVPFHRDFEEVNLRFYVRYRGPEGWRRGAVFLSEIVPRPAIAWVANTLYQESYRTLPTRYWQHPAPEGTAWGYAWKLGPQWNRMEGTAVGAPQPLRPGSPEAFIAEHYWGYGRVQWPWHRQPRTLEYAVEHPSWRVQPVRDFRLAGDLPALYGAFAPYLEGTPDNVFLAEGSPVVVRFHRLLPASSGSAELGGVEGAGNFLGMSTRSTT